MRLKALCSRERERLRKLLTIDDLGNNDSTIWIARNALVDQLAETVWSFPYWIWRVIATVKIIGSGV